MKESIKLNFLILYQILVFCSNSTRTVSVQKEKENVDNDKAHNPDRCLTSEQNIANDVTRVTDKTPCGKLQNVRWFWQQWPKTTTSQWLSTAATNQHKICAQLTIHEWNGFITTPANLWFNLSFFHSHGAPLVIHMTHPCANISWASRNRLTSETSNNNALLQQMFTSKSRSWGDS